MTTLYAQMSAEQADALSKMLGFEGVQTRTFASVLRSIPALPGHPMLRDIFDAYLDAVRERAGA